MQKIIYYNNKTEEINIPDNVHLTVLSPNEGEPKSNVLACLLKNPDISRDFNNFIQSSRNLLIIVNDASRPTPTADFLDLIYDRIEKLHPKFLIATGLHPAPDGQEMKSIFGNIYNQIKDDVIVHNSRNISEMVDLGRSRNDTKLTVNRAVIEADKVLTISSIEPHYFAGYTGGRKSILPGVAGYETIEQNHRQALHPNAKPLILENNPVHEDMLDMIDAIGIDRFYSFQSVLDRHHRIIYVSCGNIHESFDNARLKTHDNFCLSIPVKVDILISVAGSPFDASFYQSLKAIENTKNILNESGIFILITSAYKGIGPVHFARLFNNKTNLTQAAENAITHYQLGDHIAVNLKSIMTWAKLWCVTDKKNRKLENAGIKLYPTSQQAINDAIITKGDDARIAIVEDGCFTVPTLKNKEEIIC